MTRTAAVERADRFNPAQHDYGITLYGWDGDALALEYDCNANEMRHYFYEKDSFIPLLQVMSTTWSPRHVLDTPAEADGNHNAGDLPHNKYARVGFEKPAWYHCDHLGTPLEMTDDTGAIVWQASYSAFGITTIREGRQGLNTFGHSGKPLNDQYQNNLRFQGQQYDEETGLHYNRHRYYDPSQGRYLSLDPIGLAGGDNLYGYVYGNPVMLVDPTGRFGIAGMVIGAVGGVAGGYVSGGWQGAVAGGIVGAAVGAFSPTFASKAGSIAGMLIPASVKVLIGTISGGAGTIAGNALTNATASDCQKKKDLFQGWKYGAIVGGMAPLMSGEAFLIGSGVRLGIIGESVLSVLTDSFGAVGAATDPEASHGFR